MLRTVTAILLSLSLLIYGSGVAATTASSSQKLFLNAEQALKMGHTSRYKKIRAQLNDYPLTPYLEYEFLHHRLSRTATADVENFLSRYADTPLHDRLYYSWLKTLARHGRWQQLINSYQPTNSVTMKCYYRRALYHTGHSDKAFDQIESLWLVGHSQPRACDPLFKAWQNAGLMNQTHVWQRFALAMKARKTQLAGYLVRFLPDSEKSWAQLWLHIHRKPDISLKNARLKQYHPMRNAILIHGIKRLANKQPDRAAMLWRESLEPSYPFNERERTEVERSLAMSYALLGRPEALSWLATINVSPEDSHVPAWRIRAALDQQHWDAALAWIHALDEEQRHTPRWQYWRARALTEQGQQEAADEIFLTLAQTRSYYGFMAADHLELPYRFEQQTTATSNKYPLKLNENLALLRARELFQIGRIVDARREWLYATRQLPEHQLPQAALLAHQWGWHDRAIMTLARSRYRDDLTLRFPLAYQDSIIREAKAYNINPELAFALIRQESAFTADARSHAGALGLMQLMPRTARNAAKHMGLKSPNRRALINSETNLKLGMHHLHKVLNKYNGNPVLATAAYNAGEYRVKQWIPENGSVDAALWTETLPFTETRNYIQNIMLFATIYQQRLGNKITPLNQRMLPVTAPNTVIASSAIIPQ